MPDTRSHRGAHPDDERLFAPEALPLLQSACADLCWLLSRGYANPSSIKLVGDRYALSARQRTAVARCACSDQAAERRRRSTIAPADVAGRALWIDGYNALTTIEAALGGGVILAACDGCYRDMASMHGSYRKVAETLPALQLLGEFIAALQVSGTTWLLDSPVSNSGRLKTIIQKLADESGWNWDVALVQNPDSVLAKTEHVVASADSMILDGCACWLSLARLTVEKCIPDAHVVDLSV